MKERDGVAQQREFYDRRSHEHLRARKNDHYAKKIVGTLASTLGIGPQHRVLEVGAGFGRFTFDLLDHCASVVALDLSDRVLDLLSQERDARGISEERCRTCVGDLDAVGQIDLEHDFDFVVGFFLLHHLPDFGSAIQGLTSFLQPGGGMGFLEPNRRNPLFLAQVACCPDMTWAEEKGMFKLGQRDVTNAYESAGLSRIQTRRFGFFPPQIVNGSATARRLEAQLEGVRILNWVLPFLLLTAMRPPQSGVGE